MATSYSNIGGTGQRRPIIDVTMDMGHAGNEYTFVDGVTASGSIYLSPNRANPAGKFIKFQFTEAVLIDEAKFYQSSDASHGTWKWQGSNNNSDWTDIGSSFTLGGATTQTQTELNGNTDKYIYYRLVGVSGEVSATPNLREFEFKIDETAEEYSYLSDIGFGDRSASITVTDNTVISQEATLVDGAYTNSAYFAYGAASGKYVRFDFGEGNAYVITEAIFCKSNTTTVGTWKWQGSNNASDWTDIGSEFTLGDALKQVHTQLNGNTTAYRYYQLLGTAGNTSSSPYIYEIVFKVQLFISTTLAPTTIGVTTNAPTTLAPSTVAATTLVPTTLAPSTQAPTTQAPTTLAPTTLVITTEGPTTSPPTTMVVTTLAPTTVAPTTIAPTTAPPVFGVLVGGKLVNKSILFGRLVQ